MSDDFWIADPAPTADGRPRRSRGHDRDLTRDEVFVPEVYGGFLGEIERDAAYIGYKVIKRSGWVGRLYVVLQSAFLFTAVLGGAIGVPMWLVATLYALAGLLFLGMLVAMAVRLFR